MDYVVEKLDALGVPVFQPAGGHAIYLDAKAFLPPVPPQQYPGQALACALYLEGGIRSCEIGSVMFGKNDPATGEFQPAMLEMVRLAIPRRVYTQSHMDYVVECIGRGVRAAGRDPGDAHRLGAADPAALHRPVRAARVNATPTGMSESDTRPARRRPAAHRPSPSQLTWVNPPAHDVCQDELRLK